MKSAFGVFCAREPQAQAGWLEQLLDKLHYSKVRTPAASDHFLVSGGLVHQQEAGKVSQSSGSARLLLPWGRGSRTNLCGRKSVNQISAYALGCQTGDKWVRSPLKVLQGLYLKGLICREREGMFRWVCLKPLLLFLSD